MTSLFETRTDEQIATMAYPALGIELGQISVAMGQAKRRSDRNRYRRLLELKRRVMRELESRNATRNY